MKNPKNPQLEYFLIVSVLFHIVPWLVFRYVPFSKKLEANFFSVKLIAAGERFRASIQKANFTKQSHSGGGNTTELSGDLLAQKANYEMLLASQIEKHRYYPPMALRLQREGVPVVKLCLGRKGELLELSLEKSSGEKILDEAALDIIARAQPFPPLPEEYSRYLEQMGLDRFVFYAPIGFRIRQTY